MSAVNLSILRQKSLQYLVKAYNFELLVCGETGRGNTIFDELRLEFNHILNLALAYTHSRRPIKLFFANLFCLLKHEAV